MKKILLIRIIIKRICREYNVCRKEAKICHRTISRENNATHLRSRTTSGRAELSFNGKDGCTWKGTEEIPSGIKPGNIFINLANFPTMYISLRYYVMTRTKRIRDFFIGNIPRFT